MERIVLHIDMDYFFAQIEERNNPQFIGKPVVVGADPKQGTGRGVVSTANYVARKYGVHSALPISMAWRLCPEAVFLPVDMELYQKISAEIMDIAKKYSEQMEQVSLDETYLDISYVKTYQAAEELAKRLKEEILEKEKLTGTVGIGPNKLIAKMASERGKPDGLLLIGPEMVQEFLDQMDIEKLPGVGQKTASRLRPMGVNKISELRKITQTDLISMFGKVGAYLYDKSRGIDCDPVISERAIKSIGKEHTFEEDTRDSEFIFKIFDGLIKEVFDEVTKNSFSFKTITVVCRFSGFETHTKAKSSKHQITDFKILEKEAKTLLLKFFLENQKPVRLVGVRVTLTV